MSHFVYIIFSKSKDRFYVGETINVQERIRQHNSGFYQSASTKIAIDWVLFFEIQCTSKSQAQKLERFIKRMKSRKFYFKMKDDPKLVNDLLNQFSE